MYEKCAYCKWINDGRKQHGNDLKHWVDATHEISQVTNRFFHPVEQAGGVSEK